MKRLITTTVLAAGLVVVVPAAVAAGIVERQLRRWTPSIPSTLVRDVAQTVEAARRSRTWEANRRYFDEALGFVPRDLDPLDLPREGCKVGAEGIHVWGDPALGVDPASTLSPGAAVKAARCLACKATVVAPITAPLRMSPPSAVEAEADQLLSWPAVGEPS